MGIKNFTKVFNHSGKKDIKIKELNGLSMAIDASVELYRSSLGMKNINTLTDPKGNPTIHINVILSNIINYKKNKINQIWVFDFDTNKSTNKEYHNPLKVQELIKRKEKKDKARKEIINLKKMTDDGLFTDSDEEACEELCEEFDKLDKLDKKSESKLSNSTIDKIHCQEKRCFSLNGTMINDIKFILNCLNIKWVESPEGYEAEQICACLTSYEDKIADIVMSSDVDSLLFGATTLIKKNTRDKKYYKYDLENILTEYELELDDLRKIGIILGCDFAKKTPRIGIKTVLKKYKDTKLTEEQEKALEHFSRKCPPIKDLEWNNEHEEDFNLDKINILLDWLEIDKGFNRDRIKKQLSKIIPELQ